MKIRFFDIVLAVIGVTVSSPLFLLIYISLAITGQPPIFIQRRLGRNKEPFHLVKFRTMKLTAPNVASHEVELSQITIFGRFLRKSKLDELPQLVNVLRGEMSIVGYRPCLPGQHAVIAAREKLGLHAYKPGITGYSQISGIDMSTPERLSYADLNSIDLDMCQYFRFIMSTILSRQYSDAAQLRK